MFDSFVWLFSFPKLEKGNFIKLFADFFDHRYLQSYQLFKVHADVMDTLYMFDKFCHVVADPLCSYRGPRVQLSWETLL